MESNKKNDRLYSVRHIRRLVKKRTTSDLQRIFVESLAISKRKCKEVSNCNGEQVDVAQISELTSDSHEKFTSASSSA